jgi:hemerythrin superfamily protein
MGTSLATGTATIVGAISHGASGAVYKSDVHSARPAEREATMNAIELLKKDHQKVAGLFKKYEGAGDDASSEKEELFRMIKRELDVHARIEEEIFYPAAKQVPSEEAKELVAEAGEEHKQIKTLLAELDGMDADDEQFDAKMTVLKEDVEHHVEEEQDEMFPKVRKALGNDRLEDLGRQLEARKQSLAAEQGEDEEDAEEVGTRARASQGMGRATVPRSSMQSSGRGSTSSSDDDWDDESESQETGSGSGSREGVSMTSRGGASSDARDDAMAAGSRSGSKDGRSRPSSSGRSRSTSRGRSGSSSRGRSASKSRSTPGRGRR